MGCWLERERWLSERNEGGILLMGDALCFLQGSLAQACSGEILINTPLNFRLLFLFFLAPESFSLSHSSWKRHFAGIINIKCQYSLPPASAPDADVSQPPNAPAEMSMFMSKIKYDVKPSLPCNPENLGH